METSEKSNALAELAEELRVMSLDVVGDEETVLDKAYRIIAELAKVLDERTYGNRTFYLISSADAVEKCRAIAEEDAPKVSDVVAELEKVSDGHWNERRRVMRFESKNTDKKGVKE